MNTINKQHHYLENSSVSPDTEKKHRSEMPDAWERYEFAANFVEGKKVIDIACGPGYGTALLSRKSGKVALGLDVDEKTINIATQNYGHIAEFKRVKSYNWLVDSNSIDVVVSLETFEHLDNPDAFLQEIFRVLKRTGSLIISTPCNETEARFHPPNPFHLREYNWTEMGDFISKYFKIEARYSQTSNFEKARVKLNKSPLALIKAIAPRGLRTFIHKSLTKRGLKNGEIILGYNKYLTNQLLIASKNS